MDHIGGRSYKWKPTGTSWIPRLGSRKWIQVRAPGRKLCFFG
jgi:hypothetical protein